MAGSAVTSTSNLNNGYNQFGQADIGLTINGKYYNVNRANVPIGTSLNTFIRNYAHLPGTKFMCLEGGCGACIVTVTGKHPVTKEYRSWGVNSCLTPIYACDGFQVTTIEGVGNKKDGYHAAQTRLAQFHGTQCGYCSPGMVMNMYSLLQQKNGKLTMAEIENSFGGNICRCTGYRPILDAFKSLATDADPKYKEICGDIEDITKICPKTGNACSGNCNGNVKGLNLVFADGKEWIKVTSVAELLKLWNGIGKRSYSLIAGNTAHGVYRRDPNIEILIDINDVEELRRHEENGDTLTLGANVSLTDAIDILQKIATKSGFEYCKQLAYHIDLIANVPVRNAGTLAGNISIKHAHNEFPSDLFLILATVGAELGIVDETSKKVNVKLEEYIKMDMAKKLITEIKLKPLNPQQYTFKSFKIMPRAQNAHAYVNAGFLIETQGSLVLSAKICFGGINSKFLHATKTETFLKGKELFKTETVQNAIKVLTEELCSEDPEWILPDAKPEYRFNLAVSLFYKFILATCPKNKLQPIIQSGGQILQRPISSGVQVFDTYKDKWPMTQPIQKVEGLVQCSGEAQFANDIPHQPGELWAAFIPATHCNAKIISIDGSEALNIPGVHHIFTAKDIPGLNSFAPVNMGSVDIEEVFCAEKVKFYGQPVGMILADSFQLAYEATKFVKVEYAPTADTVIPTIKEVFEKNATDRFSDNIDKKKASSKGKKIQKTFKGHFEMLGQYHFTMEPQTTICIPIEDGMEVYSSTQWVDYTQISISQCLKISENSINMHVRRLGGGYGGKITRGTQVACACALACKLTNRPVRFVLNIESNMAAMGKRAACFSDYEISIDETGKIQHLMNNFAQDYGCSANEDVIMNTKEFFSNCYDRKSYEFQAKRAITNSASNTWCRAPGTTEGIAMIENMMEHIAREANLDPIDVRMANIPKDNKMRTLIPEFLESVEFRKRKAEIEAFNVKNRWIKRGIAFVPMQYNQHFFGSIPVVVSIYHTDGTVAITHGGIEMGQGINTKVVQVAAHTLGIPIEYVKVKPVLNYVVPNSIVSGGSMTSEAVGYATLKACETLLARIQPVRNKMKNAKWHEVTDACHNEMIELSATHLYKGPDVQQYITWGLSCAELEVDILTGNLQLRRVDILEDTGESISPYIDVGQVEGAFVMGLGYWLSEALVYDKETGELMTNRTWNYKPPGAKDIPIDFRVTFLRNSSNPVSVLRSKATGEPALCMSIVSIFALRHALESARRDAGIQEKWFDLGAPATAEHIFLASGTKPENLIF